MLESRHDFPALWEELHQPGGRIVYLILDGGGGLAGADGATPLERAHTPNLDRLAAEGSCGLLEPVGPGITPGSGPGHLALFGYDPLHYRIVRDRRAGRISTEDNRRLCAKINDAVQLPIRGDYFFETVSEHRAVLVLCEEGLGGKINDSDPQVTGEKPRPLTGEDEASSRTAELTGNFCEQATRILQGETANCLLLRGFERYHPLPSLTERFGLHGICYAGYPMYRGPEPDAGYGCGTADRRN